jgi:hypothetical protein
MAELPICVLGIRSGSSLATRGLVALGADPGTASELLPAVPGDNPKGYWEQQPLISLNDDLLAHLGGPWWDMPALPADWNADPGLAPFRERARDLVAELFPSDRLWVWKDPRAAVTLPFWQDVMGPLRYVVATRFPGDVAASLHARDPVRHPWLESTRVYFRYLHDSLRHTADSDRMILFYDDWFEDFDAQLDRLSRFATGAPASPAAAADLRDFFESGLRHHHKRTTSDELDPETDAAYNLLLEGTDEAGRLGRGAEAEIEAQWRALSSRVGGDADGLRARTRSVWLYAHDQQRQREAELRAHADERSAHEQAMRELAAELAQVRGWLDDVNGSLSWRLTSPLRKASRLTR